MLNIVSAETIGKSLHWLISHVKAKACTQDACLRSAMNTNIHLHSPTGTMRASLHSLPNYAGCSGRPFPGEERRLILDQSSMLHPLRTLLREANKLHGGGCFCHPSDLFSFGWDDISYDGDPREANTHLCLALMRALVWTQQLSLCGRYYLLREQRHETRRSGL